MFGPNGFEMVGPGLRMDLDNYRDLVCWGKELCSSFERCCFKSSRLNGSI
jgi:hypothetical protein